MKPEKHRLKNAQTPAANTGELIPEDEIYHSMIENVEDYAILLIEGNGIVQNWNKGAEKIKGYGAAEIIGKNFRIFYTAADRKAKLPEKLLKQAEKKGRATHEGWRLRKNGTSFWGSITITAIYDRAGRLAGFTKVTKDLTEKKKADEQIRHAILEAQEKERSELGEILHDNVSQMLVTGILFVKLAEQKCSSEHLPYVKKYMEQAMDELRRISHRLNPVAELSRSMPEAVTMLVNDMNIVSKTRFEFSQQGKPVLLDDDMNKMIFRIVQELVSNILKYAKASAAKLSLTWRSKALILCIADDGVGFNVHEVKKGLGLQNMNYRLHKYNGRVVVKSAAGLGCSIRITIPISRRSAAGAGAGA